MSDTERDAETSLDYLAKKTPWWVVSLVFHAGLILLTAFIVVYRKDERAHVFFMAPPRDPPPDLILPPPEPIPPETVEEVETSDYIEVATPEPVDEDEPPGVDVEPEPPSEIVCTTELPRDNPIGPGPMTPPGGNGLRDLRISGRGDLNRDPTTEEAVRWGIEWLARHQSPDGRWAMRAHLDRCDGARCEPDGLWRGVDVEGRHDYDVGLTGLALLAFLGAGYTHVSRDNWDGTRVGEVVRHGLEYLTDHQDAEGAVGRTRESDHYMYNHLIAALALCEAYGLSGSPRLRGPAQRAVDFTIAAQNPGRGWRYTYRSGDNDSSVTGWAVMVLKSAELCGLAIRADAYAGAQAWFDEVTFESPLPGGTDRGWMAGYNFNQDLVTYIPGVNESFGGHPTMTAIWVLCDVFATHARSAKIDSAARFLVADPPVWSERSSDFYYWYYASLALFQLDGPDGRLWRSWNRAMVEALVPNQNREEGACRRGSWEPCDRWSCMGGRVYATALNTLTLEVYYRYASAFGVRRR